jgi:AcrR family transcriptional regulator
MARPRTRDYDELRRDLLDAAGRLLAQEGPQALSTRRAAQEVGTSTTAVYNLFGGKAGLLRELFLTGFGRLAQEFAAVPRDGDPETDLMALGYAYRAAALANPHLYELMFGRPIADFRPDDDALAQVQGTFHTLVRAVARCVDAGRFAPADPYDVAVHSTPSCTDWRAWNSRASWPPTAMRPPAIGASRWRRPFAATTPRRPDVER